MERLWDGETVFLLLHCLFVAYAAGASVLPAVTFALDVNAASITGALPATLLAAIEDMTTVASTPQQDNVTVTTTEEYDDIYEFQPLTTLAPVTPFERSVTFSLFLPLIAIFPLLLALIFFGLALYTCVRKCTNRIRHYRYKKRYRQYQLLKEKVANSLANRKVFPKLNGKPAGENGVKADDKKTSNDTGKTKLKADKDDDANIIVNGDVNNKNSNNSNLDAKQTDELAGDDKSRQRHLKMKTLKFELPQQVSATKQRKRVREKTPWLLGNQSCSIRVLLHLYVFFLLAAALESILSYTLYSYAIHCPMQLSASRSILLVTVFLVAVVLSRMTALVGAHVFPPNVFVLALLALCAMSATVLAVYGGKLTVVNWLFTAILGTCIGPIIPSGFTWANIYLNFNWKSISLAYWLISIGMTLFGPLGAAVFEYNGFRAVIWLVAALATTSFVLFLPTLPSLRTKNVLQLPKVDKIDIVFEESKQTYV